MACGPPEPKPVAEGTTFGHFEVVVEDEKIATLDGALRVKVGGLEAYRVERVDIKTVRFFVQGAPLSTDADIVVRNRSSEVKAGFVRFTGPSHPALSRVVSFGASLTMGSQDANVSMRSQLHGPAAQFARATGAYLPVPLVKDGFMPGVTLEDFDKQTCAFKGTSLFGTIGDRVTQTLLPKITDSEGKLRIQLARVDPDGVPDLTALTPLADFATQLQTILARLDETGAEVFMATGPDPTVLPMYDEKVKKLRQAGFPEAEATNWLLGMQQRVRDYNAELKRQLDGRSKFHLVDLHAMVNDIIANGLVIDGQTLRGQPFGGLLSLDSMHFSDTGYAVLANAYVKKVNEDLGTPLPLLDEAAIQRDDPYSVSSLRSAGFSCPGW